MTDREDVQDRVRGALLGLACGDCLGAPLEGQPIVWPDDLAAIESGRGMLRYTDDTAMAIDVAEWILATPPGLDPDPDALAARFASTFVAESWRGYGGGARGLLQRIHQGGSWVELAPAMFGGEGSFGNGAAMRVAPVGAATAGDLVTARSWAHTSAVVTHAHPLGSAAARSVAAAVAHLVIGGALDDLWPVTVSAAPSELMAKLSVAFGFPAGTAEATVVQELGNGVTAAEAVPAALAAVQLHEGDPQAVIRFAIGLGGDTDTIGAIAGAVAGAAAGASALPRAWTDRIEAGHRLLELADALADRIPNGP